MGRERSGGEDKTEADRERSKREFHGGDIRDVLMQQEVTGAVKEVRVSLSPPLGEVMHLLKELRNIHTTATQLAQDSMAVSQKLSLGNT